MAGTVYRGQVTSSIKMSKHRTIELPTPNPRTLPEATEQVFGKTPLRWSLLLFGTKNNLLHSQGRGRRYHIQND
jgi:hypothetical protein